MCTHDGTWARMPMCRPLARKPRTQRSGGGIAGEPLTCRAGRGRGMSRGAAGAGGSGRRRVESGEQSHPGLPGAAVGRFVSVVTSSSIRLLFGPDRSGYSVVDSLGSADSTAASTGETRPGMQIHRGRRRDRVPWSATIARRVAGLAGNRLHRMVCLKLKANQTLRAHNGRRTL